MDTLINNHVAQLLFRSILGYSYEFRKCFDVDFTIVFLDDTEIVLDKLAEELSHVGLVVLGHALLEWIVLLH